MGFYRGVACAFLVLGLAVSPAWAQAVDNSNSVQSRMSRLENDIRTLNQYIYRGKTPPPGEMSDTFSDDRLTQMENQVRTLTGQIEQLQFNQKKSQDAQKKMADDMEFRFSELEKKMITTPVAANGNTGVVPPTLPYAVTSSAPTKESPFPTTYSTVPVAEAPATIPVADDPQKAYDQGQLFLRQADYDAAEKTFQKFIADNPTHTLTGNAQYWLAETYYVRAMYPEAALAFGEGFEKYPQSQKAPDNLLKLGLSLVKLSKRQEACRTLGLVGKNFPDSPESIRAKAEQERSKLKCT